MRSNLGNFLQANLPVPIRAKFPRSPFLDLAAPCRKPKNRENLARLPLFALHAKRSRLGRMDKRFESLSQNALTH